ncbi:MAG: ABC transporter ATP-binding protein [Muribaculaceae bacterium]|nr:ABC transporter ATP-binding protein [Muribaculaceae bacterium]CCX48574.1 iron(III) ABC transporter ATP-binding protein [Bacteroides sp. CAG:927]
MMAQCTPAITIDNLVTGYHTRHGNKVVAQGINAQLLRGQLTCLLGPNGAGKSTLLKTLSAMLPPLDGKIFINGRDMTSFSAMQLAREIGVVLTEKLMLSNMSVYELIALGRSPYTGFWGRLSDDDRRVVDEAISQVRIETLQHRMIQTLSDGERQKVMIAKTLAQNTPIVFLDEPTAFLDYPSKVEILQLLMKLTRERELTVFLSTHDLELALQIADEVWLIDKALGVTIGTPEDLALNGDLGRYFERDGVEFDADSGLFRISSVPLASVKVSGAGPRYAMACKALNRIGVEAVDSDCAVEVNVFNGYYTVNGERCNSVAELLHRIRNFTGI